MERPADINNPFFAYGIFRPGQLGFFQLKELVSDIIEASQVAGSLLLRDGLPIIDPSGPRPCQRPMVKVSFEIMSEF